MMSIAMFTLEVSFLSVYSVLVLNYAYVSGNQTILTCIWNFLRERREHIYFPYSVILQLHSFKTHPLEYMVKLDNFHTLYYT